MQLIGMLDSPYVRRTAIGLKLLGIAFEHRAVSVFSTFEAFQALNPVVKAPTLILDDGQALMDSTLILDYAQSLAKPAASIFPAEPGARARAVRLTGLALAACEKTMQIVYEHNLRPPEKQHQPWLDRVRGQLLAAYGLLEAAQRTDPLDAEVLDHAGVAVAVAWTFTRMMVPAIVPADDFPALRTFSARCEQLPVFRDTPPV
ncbi:MAG TPA: glutathione S-transferase [Bordetella sp.]